MDNIEFYEKMLDNLTQGVYILDDKGNYVFVNNAYVELLNMPKQTLLGYNSYDFLRTGQTNFSIADIVYSEKRRVVIYQDVFDTQKYGRKNLRLLAVANPVFDDEGKVKNIVTVVQSLETLAKLQHEAIVSEVVAEIILPGGTDVGGGTIIAQSTVMQETLATAATVAKVDSAVLISGESGVGKEVIAHYIHEKSKRSDKQIIIINCASLPANLLEAELFGYEKGAFTGAAAGGKKGMFEVADGGTLFLDEINSLPIDLQGKLLRAVETKTIQRIGSTKSIQVDFRLLTATNEDLEDLIEEKKFRADLFHRLNVLPIYVPPLRERREDIIPMTNHFLYYYCKIYNKGMTFTKRSLNHLKKFDWPGNVRQLKNCIERLVVTNVGVELELNDIEEVVKGRRMFSAQVPVKKPDSVGEIPDDKRFSRMMEEGISLKDYLEQCEREYLAWTLENYSNTYKAAEVLGTSQSSVMRRKKKHNL
ncbi:MAG: sigma 54-interacting transcriptional regulator [Oscillospiraceae bacterium]|nr:sigma 54-interacting transcriptional regulator [Oscillospiraceae bacterium]